MVGTEGNALFALDQELSESRAPLKNRNSACGRWGLKRTIEGRLTERFW